MKSSLMILAAVVLVCSLGASAYAGITPLTYLTPGVVGTIKGIPGDTQSMEAGFAQNLLDLQFLSQTVVIDGHTYINSSLFDYSGTIINNPNEVSYAGSGPITVTGNWEYALAKYDGQNAGYVLFNLAAYGNELPQYSYFWGDPLQYEMSHYTPFNAVQGGSVPDGGSMAVLLGAGLIGLAGIRRMMK